VTPSASINLGQLSTLALHISTKRHRHEEAHCLIMQNSLVPTRQSGSVKHALHGRRGAQQPHIVATELTGVSRPEVRQDQQASSSFFITAYI